MNYYLRTHPDINWVRVRGTHTRLRWDSKLKEDVELGTEEVACVFVLEPQTHKNPIAPNVLRLIDGNVTGHEAWYVGRENAYGFKLEDFYGNKPLHACMGGMGYNRLVIAACEMAHVADVLNLRELY